MTVYHDFIIIQQLITTIQRSFHIIIIQNVVPFEKNLTVLTVLPPVEISNYLIIMNCDQRRKLTCLKSYRKDKSQILEPALLLSVSKAFTKPTFCVFTLYVIQFLVIVTSKA